MSDSSDELPKFMTHDPPDPWMEFLSQFDGFFFLFCTVGLGMVILSQYSRHRRRRENLRKMRSYWDEQQRMSEIAVGTNPKLRYDAGFWGEGK